MTLINFHTHQRRCDTEIEVLNIFAQDLPSEQNQQSCSSGLHPWHIDRVNVEQTLSRLKEACRQKHIIAIGECGIDRACPVNFQVQEEIFKKQIRFSETFMLPLVIHCVRAYPDLIRIRKTTKAVQPWIIHGYSGNQQQTQQLTGHNFYFSIGEKGMLGKSAKDRLGQIPLDHLFLETDESDWSIAKIYFFAAQILEIGEETLVDQIFRNYKHIFQNG